MLKKILRYFLWTLTALIVLLVIFLASAIAPLDRTLPNDEAFYPQMLESIQHQHPVEGRKFSVGFAKENLTPAHPTALAGYGNRRGKVYEAVHDSIYVRAMVITNGNQRVAIVTADLLLIPPTVNEKLNKSLKEIGFSLDNTYLGATHTHNSIGNWGEGAAGFIYGAYEDSIVTFIADKIVRCVKNASADVKPSTIRYGATPIARPVRNRLIKDGPVDSLLRAIEVVRNDGSKAMLLSYTAHPTCLFSKDMVLSRDYPGKLVDDVEARGYAFAMFMAGSVGSHGCNPPEYGRPCVDWTASTIADDMFQSKNWLMPLRDSALLMYRLPLKIGTAQAKISKDWRVRQWLFYAAFGKYQPYISALRLGDIVLLSTPCDFSGEFDPEIDSVASSYNVHAMVTSFNGAYIGYVTPLKYYDEDHYETQLMNWYGPGVGEYLVACLDKMIAAVAETPSSSVGLHAK